MEPVPGASRPAQVIVDLDVLRANLELLRRHAGPAAFMAVVKADAYGHGARRLGPVLEAAGVSWFGVALVEEGIALRDIGVRGRILVLSPVYESQRRLAIEHGLTPTVSSLQQLREWDAWGRRQGAPIRLHLKVDTGMGRLGLAMTELVEARRILERHTAGGHRAARAVRSAGRFRLEGIASHFADADTPDSPHNREQLRRFEEALEILRPVAPEGVLRHMANSAALLNLPESRHTLVRIGLALYGVDPAPPGARARPREPLERPGQASSPDLEGVMSVTCHVAEVRELPVGATVGYGSTWRASRPSRVGVLPLGYGDGVPWRLGNRGEVLTEGGRAPIVGRVSMDTMAVDLTDSGVGRGDRVVLLGRHASDRITANDLASWAGTAPYEILCGFAARLPRHYVEEG